MLKRLKQGLERIVYSPSVTQPKARVLIAHGAGAGNQHDFMESVCCELAHNNFEVISFNFPYMQTAYELDKRRPPNRVNLLIEYFISELERLDKDIPIYLAGKSMGGRVASLLAADKNIQSKIAGVFVFGYPFIPQGKIEKFAQRTAHFPNISIPFLILQGERDTFGNFKNISQQQFQDNIKLAWITSGDHSFSPLKSSGLSLQDNISSAVKEISQFIGNS